MSSANLDKSSLGISERVTLGRSGSLTSAPANSKDIKVEDLSETLKRTVVELNRELEQKNNATEKLEAILSECQKELEEKQISLKAIQAELDTIKQQAQSQGYEEGMAKNAAELQAALAIQTDAWQQNIQQLIQQHENFCIEFKSQITDVVMASVTKIIGDQLCTPDAVKKGIDHIIRESGELKDLKIFVSPAQYEQLEKSITANSFRVRGCNVVLYPDSCIEYGGCILESTNGLIDGRYEIQLEKLRELIEATPEPLI
jgi:flagellar assembly protein FliH